ncbi:P-selectin-like [Branchiostoma lanceolatum]|uniref:P-selectin-like n=1 Tax=Branchiostoma lanceolatum TaxID=7740 RepID=UPI00345656F0
MSYGSDLLMNKIAEPWNGFFRCSIPGTSSADASQSANSTAVEYEIVCLLHCNPGYDRLIYAEYSCESNGNWTIPVDINSTGITPCLAVKCPDLSRPSHGGMTCSSGYEFRYPEACNFACEPGYELTLSSSPTRQCQTNATWSGNDVECIGVKCPDLSDPLNGGMTCDRGASFRYPESCNFTCAPGYQLTTEPVRHCQTNATWSEDDATCIGVQCPALLTPTNGGMTCDNGSSFRHPENCSFTCNHGYEIHTGNDSRICEADGTWSGSSASCRGVKCPDLSSPSNGRMSCNNGSTFRHPETCSFSCNHGYELKGSSDLVCGGDEEWRGTPASCQAVKCQNLSRPMNGGMACDSGSSFLYPETCTFSCNSGYQLSANSVSRTCRADRTWSGSNATCIGVKCTDLSSPSNGRMTCDSEHSFRHPENCTFSCNSGYVLTPTSDRVRSCQSNAAWSGSDAIMIVVTDGQSSDSVVGPALALAADRVTVFAIGVAGYDHSQLIQITNNVPGRVFELAEFIDLSQDINQIVQALCNP